MTPSETPTHEARRLARPAGFEARAAAGLRDALGTSWFVLLGAILCFSLSSERYYEDAVPWVVFTSLSIAWLWALPEVFGTATYGKLGTLRIRQLDGARPALSARVTRFLMRRILLITVTVLVIYWVLAKPFDALARQTGPLVLLLVLGATVVSVCDIGAISSGGLALHDRLSRTTVFTLADCRDIDAGRAVTSLIGNRAFPVVAVQSDPANAVTSAPPQSPAASPRPDA